MRLSPNPVLRSAAWVYCGCSAEPRCTPVGVLGPVPSIYKTDRRGHPVRAPVRALSTSRALEAAFLFRGHRPGAQTRRRTWPRSFEPVCSVSEGQTDASTALGMSWAQTMRSARCFRRRRVIIPPTGNELISMLKTTSLVAAVPYSLELYGRPATSPAPTSTRCRSCSWPPRGTWRSPAS